MRTVIGHAHGHATQARSQAGRVAGVSVSVRWGISAGALVAAPAGARLLNGHAATLKRCWLVAEVGEGEQGGAWVRVRLDFEHAGGGRESLMLTEAPGAAGTITRDVEGWLSVDAPGVLAVTARAGERGAELVYARCGLLTDRLGLPGGVYDAPELVGG
jgi:hypothetical protein